MPMLGLTSEEIRDRAAAALYAHGSLTSRGLAAVIGVASWGVGSAMLNGVKSGRFTFTWEHCPRVGRQVKRWSLR